MKKHDIAFCKAIMHNRGPTYASATRLFPKWLRDRTYIIYAFFRLPDDIVDSPEIQNKKQSLSAWEAAWEKAQIGVDSTTHPVLLAAAGLHQELKVPPKHASSFLAAMRMDTHKNRYANYSDLCTYMDGSAAAVGVLMTYAIGMADRSPPDKETLNAAAKLGYAMQLTNFLRDISEDYFDLGRIYLPADEMAKWGITEAHIAKKEYPKGWADFMQFQAARARKLYAEAAPAIEKLHPRGRWAVRAASQLYSAYLDKIEQSEYHVHHSNYSLSKWQKLRLALFS